MSTSEPAPTTAPRELYHTDEDPRRRDNRWDDPDQVGRRDEMQALIYDELLNRPLFHPMPEPGALI